MSVLPRLRALGGIALDFVFPKSCLGCGREGDFICCTCLRSLPRVVPPVCPKCGRTQVNGVICPACVRWNTDLDGIRSPFRFEGVIRQAIHELKYRNLRSLAGRLAIFLAEYLTADPVEYDVIVPVPLHPRRLRERGYNQSALLARELARLTGGNVMEDSVIRRQPTRPQARTLSVQERRLNVAGAFECHGRGLADLRVLLIDDVATSAATLDACATALKQGGAVSVRGMTLAREM